MLSGVIEEAVVEEPKGEGVVWGDEGGRWRRLGLRRRERSVLLGLGRERGRRPTRKERETTRVR